MIEARGLTKRYGARAAVSDLTFAVRPGIVDIIELVGFGDVADKRVRGFSLGMGQRLGIASALLAHLDSR